MKGFSMSVIISVVGIALTAVLAVGGYFMTEHESVQAQIAGVLDKTNGNTTQIAATNATVAGMKDDIVSIKQDVRQILLNTKK